MDRKQLGIAATCVALAFLGKFSFDLQFQPAHEEDVEIVSSAREAIKGDRTPASVPNKTFTPNSNLQESTASIGDKSDSHESNSLGNGGGEEDAPADTASAPAQDTSFDGQPAPFNDAPPSREAPVAKTPADKAPAAKTSSQFGAAQGVIPASMLPTPVAAPRTEVPGGTVATPVDNVPDAITCVTDVGSGTFSSPQNVHITCTENAAIEYCVGAGACPATCTPNLTYSALAGIAVGTDGATHCLAFNAGADDSSATTSGAITYAFASVPNLEVDVPKIVYQTTQLQGEMSLWSDDATRSNYWLGIVNLKTNDPDDYTCEEIAEGTGTFGVVPGIVQVPYDASAMTSGQTLDVTFGTGQLDYGDNWITSYAKNMNFISSNSYACESIMVTLADFNYFEAYDSTRVVNGSGIVELSGGFTPMGTFEPDPTLTIRAPAGTTVESHTSKEVRTGMFGIFFL
ncbi:MAG TPA: hypothetical protein VNJ08_04840 [Bacteriovoracaceae bacterium]|nr:hypothetical protein [Bacteriovoracaceae bacterium]